MDDGRVLAEYAEEFFAVASNPADPHNAYFRQVITYWEMAAAMVLHGAVSAELFVDSNAEGFFLLAKFSHILDEIREKNPTFHEQDFGTGEPVYGSVGALRGYAQEC